MTEVLDQAQDISRQELHRLTTLYPPPDFVKRATAERLYGDPDAQPRHTYADQLRRLYPTHTAPATWVSTLFFLDKQAQYEPADATLIRRRLADAATFHGIAGEIALLETKMAQVVQPLAEVPDSDFAVVWVSGDEKTRHYPLRNGKEVRAAAEYFAKYANEFTFADRHKIANRVLSKAQQYGVDITEYSEQLEKSAGWGTCAVTEAAKAVDDRAYMLTQKHPKYAAELHKLAGVMRQDPLRVRDGDTLCKLASIVDAIDQETGLHRHYATGELQRVEDMFFEITPKVVQAFVATKLVLGTGTVYDRSALEKLAYTTVQDWMGDQFAQAVSAGRLLLDTEKLAEIAPTLDRGEARTFDLMMDAVGIRPVYHEKAASHAPLSGDNLLKQARLYKPQPA